MFRARLLHANKHGNMFWNTHALHECMMSFPIWRFGQNHFRHYTNFISNRSLSMSAGVVQSMDYSVIHDEKNKEFYINVGQGMSRAGEP